ncbi:hypothetical protein ACFWZW_04280 [Microbacterium enclense]|uniref:hypothetical protein n=1 Tax=Microbacterium enclense TaxID=993073 RepID=UPI0036DD3C10
MRAARGRWPRPGGGLDLWIDEGLGGRVVWFSPLDAATGTRLERLAALQPEQSPITAVA